MELRPSEFWSLTPAEYNHLRLGYYRRKRLQLEREGAWVVLLMNRIPQFTKTPKTWRLEELIGFSEEQQKEFQRKRLQKMRERQQEEEQSHG